MKRFFRLALAALAMLFVMLLSAAITLRLALHGGEVPVPNFSGMTVAEATSAALHAGLDLNIENRFYSTTVPAGRMLSQAPAPGSEVRHGWQVRVTQSLGPQQVVIPDVTGEPVRVASIDIRRMGLDLGTLAHIDAPGDPDMVLTQSPPPNAGVDQPRVSLLLSSTGSPSSALIAPSFAGMSYAAATRAASAIGIHVAYVSDTPPPPVATTPATGTPAPAASPTPSQPTATPPATPQAASAGVKLDANGQAIAVPVVPTTPSGSVTSQKPDAGYRIMKGDTVHLVFGHDAMPDSTTPPSPAP